MASSLLSDAVAVGFVVATIGTKLLPIAVGPTVARNASSSSDPCSEGASVDVPGRVGGLVVEVSIVLGSQVSSAICEKH